jgi:mannose-6-phosphate isomerase-like protein (cupin superfamily)
MPKRVVTAVNPEGRSYVASCEEIVFKPPLGIVWDHDPADSQLGEWIADIHPDRLIDLGVPPGGFHVVRQTAPPAGPDTRPPFWHTTKTIDFVFVLEGRLTLMLDDGSVELEPGDVVIQRATHHAWRNDGSERAVAFGVSHAPLRGGEE